ncbi:polyhydroxyalkanoate granule-associated phasin [Diaphorobacter sp.]|uniref:polyhydroxyalkanoate granule-associated phasin n=1 Tax=Diaphorobacter sp. TaxID=1934310 RepID=UPI0028AB0731|nr:polyhydroxyalkanoate granule-associated phasin [Diaphorobacter sp.]
MPRTRKTPSTSRQLMELSSAAPQVIAHRLTRMALASPTNPSRRDQKEFTGMIVEKQIAFAQSWWTLCMDIAKSQQSLMFAMFSGPAAVTSLLARTPRKLEKISSRAVSPIHRKAVSNAKRLSRTPLR